MDVDDVHGVPGCFVNPLLVALDVILAPQDVPAARLPSGGPMFTALLALSTLTTPADAAEIQVATTVPIQLLIDGRPVPIDEYTAVGVAMDLPAGPHTVETRNAFGKTTAYKEIELGQHQQARYEYRKKELWHIGTYDLAPPAPVAVPAEQVVVQETVMAAPGVGVTVSDGQEMVAVGVGPFGGGVTVTEGSETVSVGMGLGGVTVTETTTTTTTTAGMPGGVVVIQEVPLQPVPAEPVAMPMASGPFNALLTRMRNADFASDRHALLRTAVSNNWITCDQLRRLLDTYDFGSKKLEAVDMARDSVLDPENAFVLDDAFDFSSEKRKVQAYFQ
jgi:hypothetical protein